MNKLKKIADFDLNLLAVFVAVNEYRHITKAAQAIGLTQSALSHALNRLRVLLGDPLFVKSSVGMVPTPRAKELAEPIRDLIDSFEQKILASNTFITEQLERTFRIRSTDLIESLLIPPLLKTLQVDAPKVQVITKPAEFALPKEEMELGVCDLAIAGFFGDLPDGFYQQKLFSDHFVCAVRKNHSKLKTKSPISLDDYCDERHALIAPGGELVAKVDGILKRKKRNRFTVVGLSSFMVSGWVVSQTDTILTAPSRLIAQIGQTFSIQTFAPPFEIPDITIVQAWHERNNQDPGHKWFREQVKTILK